MQKWPSLAGQHVGTLRVWIEWSLETLAILDALSPQSRGRPKVAVSVGAVLAPCEGPSWATFVISGVFPFVIRDKY